MTEPVDWGAAAEAARVAAQEAEDRLDRALGDMDPSEVMRAALGALGGLVPNRAQRRAQARAGRKPGRPKRRRS